MTDPLWTPEAEERIKKAPVFLQGMVRSLAERKAREEGLTAITPDDMSRWKNTMMGPALASYDKGELPWTVAALERLDTTPEFMRGMVRRIAEDVAKERGHLEVNVELFKKVEELGVLDDAAGHEPMPWTKGATRRLQEKIAAAPTLATEFVLDMLKRDAEDLAREHGYAEITEEALQKLWDAPQADIEWSPEAWKRLQTSPDFVRSGIKKAAERRARKMGLKTITSERLTKYRNEAMMKAVVRIRSFGYKELTFDAFEDALKKTRRLQDNPEAVQRLAEIRRYMDTRGKVGLIDEDMLEKMQQYLKEGKSMKADPPAPS